MAADPIEQWQRWYEDASSAGVREPNAMVLATATPDGEPDARYVLIRGIDERGFVFHTNHDSAKGRQLAANPRGAGVFTWIDLHRQVRVRGADVAGDRRTRATPTSRRDPRDSQIGAWASPQSEVLADRADLDARIAAVAAEYEGATCRVRRSGAAGASASTRSSSGRDARAASTTACATAATPRRPGSIERLAP